MRKTAAGGRKATVRERSVRRVQGAPPHFYFLISATFHYLGPSFAVLLFAHVQVLGVAWLRIASAAVIFAAWRRPWRRLGDVDRAGKLLLLGWGATLAVMNVCFYSAIARLPLATVSAIEFLPVIALAAFGARTPRNATALVLSVLGVFLLTHVKLGGATLGFVFAFANALLFSLYVVLADRVAKRSQISGIDGLGMAMLIATVFVTPIGGREAISAFTMPTALLAGIGVGASSSVVPYVIDQVVLAQLPRATYATMVALLPAIATVIGIIVLTQIPSAVEVVGIMLVIAGVAVHRPADTEGTDDEARGREDSRQAVPAGLRGGGAVRRSENERGKEVLDAAVEGQLGRFESGLRRLGM